MKERSEQNENLQNPDYGVIVESLAKHEELRSECFNMIASENAMSPATRKILGSDLGNRYSVGPEERWFPGLDDYTRIENLAINLTKELLPGAVEVTVQPVSGMQANQIAYDATINRGDLVFVVPEKYGGHYSHRKGEYIDQYTPRWKGSHAETLLDEYGARVDYIPFDEENYNINAEEAYYKIIADKPKVIIVGASEMLFPVPLKTLREAADRTGVGTKIIYDAAHVYGLILGKTFQNPFLEGADIVSTSTNKTMGGPDHGTVAWSRDMQRYFNIKSAICCGLVPKYTSNHHANEVAGVAITLAELKVFGQEYANQVINNSRALAAELDNLGVKVIGPRSQGFTMSHEVLIDVTEATNCSDSREANKRGNIAKEKLAKANIMVSRCPVPYAKISGFDGEPNTGLRLGTNEMTRMGMNESEMMQIAECVADVLLNRRTPEQVQLEVRAIRNEYRNQRYCFKI